MKTVRWEGNEIIFTDDVNNNSINSVENLDLTTDILGANMIISGMVVTQAVVPDMTILIGAGLAKDQTVGTFLKGLDLVGTVTNSDAILDRRDIVEMRRLIEDVSPDTRQFKDPTSGAITSSTIDTELEYKTEIQVVAGSPGGNAPSTTAGWIKIAEILIPASSLTVVNANIYNVDAEKAGVANTNWTTDTAPVYLNGTVSGMKTKIIDNESDITTNTPAIALNTTHRGSDGKNHSDLVLNNTHRGSTGVDHFNLLNSLKGMNHIVLTEYTTTTVPAIAANSQVEINGAIYTNPSEVAITGSTSNSTWYDILLTPSGTTFTASFVARETGVWSDSKQGLYSGNNRVVACVLRDSIGNFINKNILIVVNRTAEIKAELPGWNMNVSVAGTSSIQFDQGITQYLKIRNINIMIKNDALTAMYNFVSYGVLGVNAGHMNASISAGLTQLTVVSGGAFDTIGFDDDTIIRGWGIVKYEV